MRCTDPKLIRGRPALEKAHPSTAMPTTIAPTRNQLHHYIWESLCQINRATSEVSEHPRHPVQAALTGSAALWIALHPVIGGPRCGDGTVQEEKKVNKQYWLPDDLDIPIRAELYDAVVVRLCVLAGAREVEGKHLGFKFRTRSQEHTDWPPIQVYPVDDVIASIQKHDIEAVRCWGIPQAGTVSIKWCEGTRAKRILDSRWSYIYGRHRPLGCLQYSSDNRCRFLNGIAPNHDAQKLVDKHPDRCPVGEKRVRKYRDRGFTLVPAADSDPGECPYCGATDEDPPEAQMVGNCGDTAMGYSDEDLAVSKAHTAPVTIRFETYDRTLLRWSARDKLVDEEVHNIPANHLWMDPAGDGVRTQYGGHIWVLHPENYLTSAAGRSGATYRAARYVDAAGTQVHPK